MPKPTKNKTSFSSDIFRQNKKTIRRINRLISSLDSPVRQKILARLMKGAYAVEALGRTCRLDSAVVSHHLAVLRRAGFVTVIRKGKYRHYSVQQQNLKAIISLVRKLAAL